MNLKLILSLAPGLVIPFIGSFASEPSTNSQPQQPAHTWEIITFAETLPDGAYRPLFCADWGKPAGGVSQGFRLNICGGIPTGFFKTNVISARMFRANGEIVEPTAESKGLLNSPGYSGSFGVVAASVETCFPWATNSLGESWIEVSMGKERYWLEIPYGFDRNPTQPLPPSIPRGPPKFVPPLKSIIHHNHVLRWQAVHYDLGVIQNGWRLSLIQSNATEAQSEVILYREDIKIGTSTSWKLDSPTTALRILDGSGKTIGSHCIDVHVEDGGMERISTYDIARDGDDQRCWGQLEISVDDKSYRVVVPSSLYKYAHGHASAN